MRWIFPILFLSIFLRHSRAEEWKQLASLPDKEGLAGCFAGVSHDSLIVAGGANFSGKKPWEGGTKSWYDSVYVLDQPTGEWKLVGKLSHPLGYGVSASYKNSLICVGGSDSTQHYADAFRIEWLNGKLLITKLPSLPITIANHAGALVGEHLYIVGGQEKPDSNVALSKCFRMDLSKADARWETLPDCPGNGRIFPVAAAVNGKFYAISGAELFTNDKGKTTRRFLTDAYCFEATSWKRIADLPFSVEAAPTPAPVENGEFFVLGGDDGTQVNTAPDKHLGFRKEILRYDLAKNKWQIVGQLPAPRVTTPLARWRESWVLISGERWPGIRSPEVWTWTPAKTR